MNKTILSFILIFISTSLIYGQDNCKSFLPDEGTTLVYNNYDKKGKLTSTTTTEVVSVREEENGTHYKVNQLISDGKKKNDLEMVLRYRCEDNKFIIDMQSILIAEQMQSIEGGTVVVESEEMYIPSDLKPGMELKDGSIKMDASMGYMTMPITARAFYRKVEGKEQVTTPAGTFEAWKINGNMESKVAFMRVAMKTVQWYVEDIGVVKSESYDNKGKLMGSTELQSIN
ncbi:MAG: hypothetical protein P8100_14275 [bacterium]|jgi:hypothetical protein